MLNPMTANPQCLNHGCQLQQALLAVGRATEMQRRAEAALEAAGRDNMSRAMWCDPGGHAFSERDPGRQRITIQVLDENGDEQTEFRELCGEHAVAAGLTKPSVTRPKEIVNGAEDRT